jgi:hypothetical protein
MFGFYYERKFNYLLFLNRIFLPGHSYALEAYSSMQSIQNECAHEDNVVGRSNI